MGDRLRSWLAQAVVVALVYGCFGLAEPIVDWLVPVSPAVQQARADSTLLHARLTIALALIDTLTAWQATEVGRLNEACRRLPLEIGADPTLCREWLDAQRETRP